MLLGLSKRLSKLQDENFIEKSVFNYEDLEDLGDHLKEKHKDILEWRRKNSKLQNKKKIATSENF